MPHVRSKIPKFHPFRPFFAFRERFVKQMNTSVSVAIRKGRGGGMKKMEKGDEEGR